MPLPMPTPEELEAEALDLANRAGRKERLATRGPCSVDGRVALLRDAAIFREEAASKRAKAERLRKAVAT